DLAALPPRLDVELYERLEALREIRAARDERVGRDGDGRDAVLLGRLRQRDEVVAQRLPPVPEHAMSGRVEAGQDRSRRRHRPGRVRHILLEEGATGG